MTLKHISFSESEIMRSLEKVAIEKGLISPDTMKKEASKQEAPDFSPSNDLLSNVVKLCSGLQKSGLNHFSRELEDAFFTFKTAQNDLYHAHKETGEDLIDQAHPEGSHKMEDMIGDAEFETVVDQHLKMLDMVNKKPSGKLSSAKDVIRAVKVVLADDRSNIAAEIKKNTDRVLQLLGQVLDLVAREDGVNLQEKFLRRAEELVADPTVANLDQLKKFLVYANNIIKQYVSDKTWNAIVQANIFSKMVSFIQPSIDLRKQVDDIDSGKLAQEIGFKPSENVPTNIGGKGVVDSIKLMERELAGFNRLRFNARLKSDDVQQAIQNNQNPQLVKDKAAMIDWISKTKNRIEELGSQIDTQLKEEAAKGTLDPERKKELAQIFTNKLNNETKFFDDVLGEWSK